MTHSPHLTVAITGWLDPDAAAAALASADLLLVPSRWPEPFGLAGLEAAAYGVPSVAFDAGGIRDWLVDGVNGRLVAGPPSAERFGAGIVACLSDPARLAGMGHAAAAAARRFTMDSHLAQLEAVLEEARAPSAPGVAAR
jgi:glycosyltransferase involved in cell wall biosynthesis